MASRVRNACGLAVYTTGIWIFLIGFFSLVGIVLVLISPWLFAIVALSVAWTYVYGRGHRWHAFVHWRLWRWFRESYLAYELEGEPEGLETLREPEKLSRPVLWALYPHGSYPFAPTFYWALNPRFYQRARVVVHSFVFYVPIMRGIMYWVGAIGSDEATITRHLQKGESVCICPGGISEIALPGKEVCRRLGFLRIARETGTPVVPVWLPDERSYFDHYMPLGNALERVLGFPFPLFILGRWWCPLIPKPFARSRIRAGVPLDPAEYKSLEALSDAFWEQMDKLRRGEMTLPEVMLT